MPLQAPKVMPMVVIVRKHALSTNRSIEMIMLLILCAHRRCVHSVH